MSYRKSLTTKETHSSFFLILYYTILFVTSRENMSMGSVSGIEYLFNQDPKVAEEISIEIKLVSN